MNVVNYFADALARGGQHAALISGIGSGRRVLSYAALDRRVDRALDLLQRSGLRPGDRVLIAVPVSIETYIAMLAVLKGGMVVMFIDPAHGAGALARCLRAHPPAAVVASRAVLALRLLSPELRRIPRRFTVRPGFGSAANLCDGHVPADASPIVPRSSEDSALLTFTSGSTGDPKGVVRTHGFLCSQFEILGPVAGLQPGDIDLVAMPMFVLFNLANGITSVIPACDIRRPGRADPAVLAAQLAREEANRVVASPALLERLATHCARAGTRLPALRTISTGGGPVGPALPGRLRAIAPSARIVIVYGSTEAEPIATIDHDAVSITDRKRMQEGAGLLVGRPVGGCDVRVIASRQGGSLGPLTAGEFAARARGVNEVGEIVVHGRHVLDGYADVSHNSETKIDVDGARWHRTGDAGYFDRQGRLWLVGRCSAAIRDRRGEVFPFQVEYAVSAVRGIRRAALIAESDRRVLVIETSGRRLAAECMRMARCITEREIDAVVVVPRIPMDKRHDAKVDYPALQRLLEGRMTRLRLRLVGLVTRAYRAIRRCIGGARLRALSGWRQMR